MSKISQTGKEETNRTLQKMGIESFDYEFNQNAVELLSYDPLVKDDTGAVVGGLQRVTSKSFGDYIANDIEETGGTTYIGFENLDGGYFIERIVESSGKEIRFATIINNPTKTSYSSAWTDRASLVFNTYSTAFTA
jgi:hypothetical protein